jgi:hypothetical protein
MQNEAARDEPAERLKEGGSAAFAILDKEVPLLSAEQSLTHRRSPKGHSKFVVLF